MDSEKKRIFLNTVFLYIRLALSTVISFISARIVLEKLGAADYGISSLIIGTISFFTVFNFALVQSIQRFLSFALGQKNTRDVKKIYSISQLANLGLALLVLILVETVGELLFYLVLKIPPDRVGVAQGVFQISAAAVVFVILMSVLDALIISYERFSFYAGVYIFDSFFRLAGVIALCFVPWDKLIFYSLVNLGAIVSMYIIKLIYCRVAIPGIVTLSFGVDRKLLSEIFSFSGWNLLEEIVTIVNRQTINIINNINFGVVVNAALGISDQVTNAVFMFINNFQLAFAPPLTKSYAAGHKEQLLSMLIYTTKISFFLLLGAALPLMLNIDYILGLWLKSPPPYTGIFITISLLTCFLNCLAFPVICAAKATGKIKKYQIYSNAILILNVPLCFLTFIVKNPEFPLCAFVFVNAVCVPWRVVWLSKMIPYFRWQEYFKHIVCRCAPCLAAFAALISPAVFLTDVPLYRLLMSVALTIFGFPVIVLLLGLSGAERRDLILTLKKAVSRLKHSGFSGHPAS